MTDRQAGHHVSKRLERIKRFGVLLAVTNLVLWFGAPTLRSMVDTALERVDHPLRPTICYGVQEALVYMDPWFCWGAMPAVFIAGFAAVPILAKPRPVADTDTTGQRTIALSWRLTLALYAFFEAVYLFLLFVGISMRGPDWNLYWPGEKWDDRITLVNNLNLSEFIWSSSDLPSSWFQSELPRMGLLLGYFVCGFLFSRFLARQHPTMSGFRWTTYIFVFQVAGLLPLKMLLRWCLRLRYFVETPFVNI